MGHDISEVNHCLDWGLKPCRRAPRTKVLPDSGRRCSDTNTPVTSSTWCNTWPTTVRHVLVRIRLLHIVSSEAHLEHLSSLTAHQYRSTRSTEDATCGNVRGGRSERAGGFGGCAGTAADQTPGLGLGKRSRRGWRGTGLRVHYVRASMQFLLPRGLKRAGAGEMRKNSEHGSGNCRDEPVLSWMARGSRVCAWTCLVRRCGSAREHASEASDRSRAPLSLTSSSLQHIHCT